MANCIYISADLDVVTHRNFKEFGIRRQCLRNDEGKIPLHINRVDLSRASLHCLPILPYLSGLKKYLNYADSFHYVPIGQYKPVLKNYPRSRTFLRFEKHYRRTCLPENIDLFFAAQNAPLLRGHALY